MTERKRIGRFEWERRLRDSRTVIGNQMFVLLALGTYMDADGTNARPGVLKLAVECGLNEKTVRRHLSASVGQGWLALLRRGHRLGDGTAEASEYAATVPIG